MCAHMDQSKEPQLWERKLHVFSIANSVKASIYDWMSGRERQKTIDSDDLVLIVLMLVLLFWDMKINVTLCTNYSLVI